MVSLQGITVDDVGFGRSIKQGEEREFYLVQHALLAETSQYGMEGATTRLQNTNGC